MRELLADISGLPVDKDLVFYCHSGGRSAAATTLVSEKVEKHIRSGRGHHGLGRPDRAGLSQGPDF
ncbi:MAG: hypothetical protein JW883_15620 [Deltaproteobacteria bacterium]|nr:hypothetical protein [Deltaproteobacteria bacterium]